MKEHKPIITKNIFGNDETRMKLYLQNVDKMQKNGITQYILVDDKAMEYIKENKPHYLEPEYIREDKTIIVRHIDNFLAEYVVEEEGVLTQEDVKNITEFADFAKKQGNYVALNDLYSQLITSYNAKIAERERFEKEAVFYHLDADVLLSANPTREANERVKEKNISFIACHRVTDKDNYDPENNYAIFPIAMTEAERTMMEKTTFKNIFEWGSWAKEANQIDVFARGFSANNDKQNVKFLAKRLKAFKELGIYEPIRKGEKDVLEAVKKAPDDYAGDTYINSEMVDFSWNEAEGKPNNPLLQGFNREEMALLRWSSYKTVAAYVNGEGKRFMIPFANTNFSDFSNAGILSANELNIQQTYIDGSWGGRGVKKAYISPPLSYTNPDAKQLKQAYESLGLTETAKKKAEAEIQKIAAIKIKGFMQVALEARGESPKSAEKMAHETVENNFTHIKETYLNHVKDAVTKIRASKEDSANGYVAQSKAKNYSERIFNNLDEVLHTQVEQLLAIGLQVCAEEPQSANNIAHETVENIKKQCAKEREKYSESTLTALHAAYINNGREINSAKLKSELRSETPLDIEGLETDKTEESKLTKNSTVPPEKTKQSESRERRDSSDVQITSLDFQTTSL